MAIQPLPIDRSLSDITAALGRARSLVLVAEPGAGKTTRVPPAMLRAGLLSAEHPNLVMLQPRRVAARAAAMRIADENGWELGREVGYHVRFDRKVSRDTRLRVLTEGILTRQLTDDPFLEGIGAVILDEFHERSLHTDMALALLREVQQTVRPDLMLVIMSATLEAEPASRFLGDCPIVRVEGRTFPVTIDYRPQVGDRLPDRVADAVTSVLDAPPLAGVKDDVLVFLPGVDEIRRTMNLLESATTRHDFLLLPLHGSLPAEEQMAALRPTRQRKVILATNIAETSLTIDGVRTVVDAGLARVAGYDPQRGLDRLQLARISKASATQRAGRAGRTAPGRCIRLWSEKEQHAMADFELPEVHRVDLCGTVLTLHAWGKTDPRAFGWYERPPEESLAAAERLLAMLGALSSETNGQITPLGRQILSMPVHPRLGRLLVEAAKSGLLEAGATLAALMSEKDIVIGERPDWRALGSSQLQGRSDLLLRMDLLDRAARERFGQHLRDAGIDPAAARQASHVRDELLRVARRGASRDEKPSGSISSNSATEDQLLKLILLAYPDRVVRRRGSDHNAGVMVGGQGVRLSPDSVVRQGDFFVAVDARQDERSPTREAIARVASAIDVAWLDELFPQSIRRQRVTEYDEEKQRVVGRGRRMYRDLALRDDADAPVDANEAGQVLGEALRAKARETFQADESSAALLARVTLLRRAMPEHTWPLFDDAELGELIAMASGGKRSLEDVRRSAGLSNAIRSAFHYPLDRVLETEAPESVTVPTGNAIRLEYANDTAILAVRLQELFGWTDTPRIAGGRVPVVLHLLGPNYRPVQVTSDLRSFWKNTYPQVRKDLRARYPKHSWPDDPFTAAPQAKGGRRTTGSR